MLGVERRQCDILRVIQCFLALIIFELQEGPLLHFLVVSVANWVPICINLTTLVFLLLDDFNAVFTGEGISLHAIPHAVSFVMNIVDAVPVHFGASVDDLPRSDPLLVIFL